MSSVSVTPTALSVWGTLLVEHKTMHNLVLQLLYRTTYRIIRKP